MFGDTITLPLSTGNVVLAKINQDGYSAEYLKKESLQEYTMKIRHSKTNATATKPSYDRHNVEVTVTIYATESVPEHTRKVYFVMEALPNDADIVLMDGIADWAIASTNANLTKLVGWES